MDRNDELLERDDLTDEELAELERHLVATTREFHKAMADLAMAKKLERSADSVLRNVEKAASLPWPDGSPGALADWRW